MGESTLSKVSKNQLLTDSILKKFSDTLRNFRKRIGLRQAEVAEKIDLSLRHYQKIEAGEVNVPLSAIEYH